MWVCDFSWVRRFWVIVFSRRIQDGHAVDCRIHGQGMRLHGVRAFCLAKLANSQAYGIAEDGNSKEREDRKSVVYGKSVDLGGRRIIKKKKKYQNQAHEMNNRRLGRA